MEIKIKINADGLNDTLNTLADACQNREPLMRNLSEQLLDCVHENFAQQGRPAWKPTSRGGMILQDTRRLLNSITPSFDNSTARAGTNLVYAAIHNNGGKTRPHVIKPKRAKALKFNGRYAKSVNHPGSDIPARTFLSVTDEDIVGFVETTNDYIASHKK